MMYEFLERLISIALPRTRDFRGLSYKSFDGKGNYNFGIKEQIIFTEINYDKIQAIRGLNITLVTTSKTDDEAYELLKSFGFPLKEKPVKNRYRRGGLMAKKSKIVREHKLIEKVQKYASIRAELKNVIKDPNSSVNEKRDAVSKLDRLPKSSSKIRIRNRCFKTGRPRGCN